MEPTQPAPNAPTTPVSPAVGEPLVEFIRLQRSTAAIVLGGLAVLFLLVGGFLATRALRTPTAPTPDKPLTNEKSDPEKPPELPKTPLELENLQRGDYTVGWISCLFAFMLTSAASLWLFSRVPLPGIEQQKTEARVLILWLGQGLGIGLILSGLVLFYRWSESLSKWLDTTDTSELRWVLVPLMMIVTGVGIIFVSIHPARAEERNNATIRKVVYGANFSLTVLLLLVALVVVNVVIAVKVPNKLDTTETGFYDLSDKTRVMLAGLKEPITAYVVLPEGTDRDLSDIRQLMLAYQDAGKGKFRLKFLDPIANRQEFNTLRAKYPQLNITLSQQQVSGAVLLTVGDDEKRHAVIPDTDFTSAQDRKPVFQGEGRMFRELVILADTDTKPVVYFTQSNGEMSIDPAAEAPDDQKLSRLRAYLEKNYLEVRPLTLPLENPSIPSDAAALVVVEPRVPFTPAAVEAIKKYMNDPAKKGKLLVMAGPVPGPGGVGVSKTGLEDLLGEYNVLLGNKFVYTYDNEIPPIKSLAAVTNVAKKAQNEIAVTISEAAPALVMDLPREVSLGGNNPSYQAMPLLASLAITWVEEDRVPNQMLMATRNAFARDDRLQIAKQLTDRPRPLGVVVSAASAPAQPGAPPAPGTPTLAVYGNGAFVSDAIGRRGAPDAVPIQFALVGVTIDWLRGKPSIAGSGIDAKKYSTYQYPQPATVDNIRLVWLPLALTFLSVFGLGFGVWFVRRR